MRFVSPAHTVTGVDFAVDTVAVIAAGFAEATVVLIGVDTAAGSGVGTAVDFEGVTAVDSAAGTSVDFAVGMVADSVEVTEIATTAVGTVARTVTSRTK